MARIVHHDHTSFTVDDIDRTVAFWTNVMGFALDDLSPRTQPWLGIVVDRPGATCRVAHLTGHGCHLEFIAYDAAARGESVFGPATRPGAAHVAFFVDDIEGFAAQMEAGGGRRLGEIALCGAEGHNRDCRAVYMTDPGGIIVELVEDLPGGT